MQTKLEKINGFSILSVNDERIDAHNSSELKDRFIDLIEQGEYRIVVQLDRVRFIDSSGLGALLFGHKNVVAKSGRFILTGSTQQVLSMFELTRLNRIFEIYSDLTEAFAN